MIKRNLKNLNFTYNVIERIDLLLGPEAYLFEFHLLCCLENHAFGSQFVKLNLNTVDEESNKNFVLFFLTVNKILL